MVLIGNSNKTTKGIKTSITIKIKINHLSVSYDPLDCQHSMKIIFPSLHLSGQRELFDDTNYNSNQYVTVSTVLYSTTSDKARSMRLEVN